MENGHQCHIPHWHSMTTGRGESGYTEDVEKVVDDLSKPSHDSENHNNESDSLKRLKDLNLVMIYADWCGHCNTTKKIFKQSGVVDGEHIEMLTSDEAEKKYGVTVEALHVFINTIPKKNILVELALSNNLLKSSNNLKVNLYQTV